MRNLFDDLFNEFFGELFNRYDNDNGFSEYLKMIAEGKAIPLGDEAYSTFNIDENKPDETFYEEKNGLYIKTNIWHTPHGDVTFKAFSDTPFNTGFTETVAEEPENANQSSYLKIKLQHQLEQALANEDYEEAARLRDLISPPTPKKVRKPRAKKPKE